MKQFRVFIENLPETVTEPEIRSKFSSFGDVKSIDIKERKVITVKHSSCFFAYVNLSTDDSKLQKCFQTFNEVPWCGQFVKLQIAKESFLERLKRERELNAPKDESVNTSSNPPSVESTTFKSDQVSTTSTIRKKEVPDTLVVINKKNLHKSQEKKIQSSSSDSSDDEEEEEQEDSLKKNTTCRDEKEEATENEVLQIKKSNTGSRFVNGLLKIEDYKKGHIVPDKTVDNKKILDDCQAEAEARRKKAVRDKIRAYHQQKKAFTTFKANPKIIKFKDDDDEIQENVENYDQKKKTSGKVTLFDSSDSETEELDIQKNIENRMKSEQRFALDHRFEEDPIESEKNPDDEQVEDGQRNLKILEEVLGKKVKRNVPQDENGPGYIRYDPSNLDHSKYEVREEKVELKKKKKRTNEKEAEIKEAPEVSKERVYSNNVDFKSLLGKSGGFSLTEMFGNDKKQEEKSVCEETPIPLKNNTTENPFKYDSSDDEDEVEEVEPQPKRLKKAWTEPLFFQDDDFRFQEGLDFVKRIASQKRKEGQLEEERDKLKKIVRSKMRNVNKKNKRFQRKLGGSKKKKMKRIDKALKR